MPFFYSALGFNQQPAALPLFLKVFGGKKNYLWPLKNLKSKPIIFPTKMNFRGIFRQFSTNISILSRLHHPNLVLFIGVQIDPQTLNIITEYYPFGDLFTFLHSPDRKFKEISWALRLKIALDIACGLGIHFYIGTNPNPNPF